MAETRDDTIIAFGGSLLLHAGIVAIVLAALWLKPEAQVFDVAGPVIEATLVDFSAPPLPASASRPKPQPPTPEPPKPTPEPPPPPQTQPEPVTPPRADDRVDQEKVRLAAEALEQAEREQEERIKQEQIELEREQDELVKMEQERQKQLEDIRRQREEAEKQRKLEEVKLAQLQNQNRKAEAEQQRELERQRMEELAAEEAQRAGTNGRDESLLGQYVIAIRNSVTASWLRPDSVQSVRCTVRIIQIIGGDVISASVVGNCNADELTRRSIEAAVQRASPLPYRGFESVFVRSIDFNFCYPETLCGG